jgi:hypothetical protein
MTVIHTYDYYSGGIGDLLRSVFAYYVYCQINKIDYYFSVPDSHPFSKFFTRDPKTPRILNEHTCMNNGVQMYTSFTDLKGKYTSDTQKILDSIKHNENVYVIKSNVFNFIDFETLAKYRYQFLDFLKLSDIVKDRMNVLEPKTHFNAIHLRLGDAYMDKVNIASDVRYTGTLDSDLEKVYSFFNASDRSEVIMFTDSNKLKSIHSKIKFLNTKVNHSALPSSDDFLDSFVEFLILGRAKKIVAMSNSGFSFWSAFIFNVPLFLLKKGEVVELTHQMLLY